MYVTFFVIWVNSHPAPLQFVRLELSSVIQPICTRVGPVSHDDKIPIFPDGSELSQPLRLQPQATTWLSNPTVKSPLTLVTMTQKSRVTTVQLLLDLGGMAEHPSLPLQYRLQQTSF